MDDHLIEKETAVQFKETTDSTQRFKGALNTMGP